MRKSDTNEVPDSLGDGCGKQHCRYLGIVGIRHKQEVQTIAVQSSVDALYLVWPVKPAQGSQPAIIVDYPDRGADAASIVKCIIGVLSDSTENHVAVRQRSCVGKAQGNSFDQAKIEPADGGWLDGISAPC